MNHFILIKLCLGILTILIMPDTLYSAQKQKTAVSAELQAKIIKIIEDKCLACHERDPKLPAYASIPGIKQMIEQDAKDGLRAEDLDRDVIVVLKQGKKVDESSLAKLEWVVLQNTMPPAKFTAIRWSSKLTEEDKKNILAWVKAYRAAYYATGLASSKRANEPIQPIPGSIPYNPKKAALGKKLFNDKRLSFDNTTSCASCHKLQQGGADDVPTSSGVGGAKGAIKAPSVFNAVYNIRQFWDGRASDLQDQASGPMLNPVEMANASIDDVLAKLSKDKELTAEFVAVYPNGWTKENLTDAIAEFEKTLLTPNSRFDRWLKGDDKALTVEEIQGYELFKKYSCATCHVGPSMGGQSFEYFDVPNYYKDLGIKRITSGDTGRVSFTHDMYDKHFFKVPNLRTVVLTQPYLHDGSQDTLDGAIQVMAKYVVHTDIPQADRDKIAMFLRSVLGEHDGKPLPGKQIEK